MSVKKLPNGKWRSYIRYKDAFKRPHQKKKEGFQTKREAQQWEKKFLETHAGKALPGMTVDMLAQRYLADGKLRWKEHSYQMIYGTYVNHIRPIIGQMMVEDVTVLVIREAQALLLNEKLKPQTKQYINTIASGIFTFATRYYSLPQNPVLLSPLRCPAEKREYVIWSKEQFDRFYRRIPVQSDTDAACKLYLLLLFWGGFRRGEVLALYFGDLDFGKNIIHVSKTRINRTTTTPKTQASIRDVIMPQSIMDHVKAYTDKMYHARDDAYIFPWSRTVLDYHWSMWLGKYATDLPRIRIHDLRHSHASMLIDMDFSPQAVADRLGHTDASMVLKIYGHLYAARRTEIAEKLELVIRDSGGDAI